ncbi:MAG: hypothetical protein ACK4N5_16970 [Myxococcales bacterium]
MKKSILIAASVFSLAACGDGGRAVQNVTGEPGAMGEEQQNACPNGPGDVNAQWSCLVPGGAGRLQVNAEIVHDAEVRLRVRGEGLAAGEQVQVAIDVGDGGEADAEITAEADPTGAVEVVQQVPTCARNLNAATATSGLCTLVRDMSHGPTRQKPAIELPVVPE